MLRVITAYNHMTHDIANLKQLTSALKDLTQSITRYIIVGDLNLPMFSWNNSLLNKSEPNAIFIQFIDDTQPFYQLIKFPTRGQNLLNVIITIDLHSNSDNGKIAY